MRELGKRLIVIGLTVVVSTAGYQWLRRAIAQEGPDWNKDLPQQHNSVWKVHDINRPKPRKVEPGARPGAPPADAIVLFDGKDLSRWTAAGKQPKPARWRVENGYMEVNDTGSIRTKEEFGDCQLHLEYMAPTPPKKVSQGRGNSGIIFMSRYEVQVLDNHDNPTYSDGYIGAVYGQHPPLVNAGRKPGEWQTYDIVFRRPRFKDGEVVEPGRFTVFLNGVLLQHNAEIYGEVAWRELARYRPHGPTGPIVLQDHGDQQTPRFRNIWLRKLDLSPEAIDNRT
ncbi:MAG: DUF1080 domain-containing protein [Planctomycetota bacterium]|nr:DUF1080 domain-containing protein [Planctomycetota bacterium]